MVETFCFPIDIIKFWDTSRSISVDMKAIERASESWDSHTLNVMLIGRRGTGRHTLARSLFGEEVDAKCNGSYPVCDIRTNGVSVKLNFWKPSEPKELNQPVDLVIYTIMKGQLSQEDEKILQQLSQTFSNVKWGRTLFAFTFANRVIKFDEEPVLEKKRQFQEKITNHIPSDLPVVLVGDIAEGKRLFEDEEPWRSHLVKCILARVKGCDAVGGIWKAMNEYVQRNDTVGSTYFWSFFPETITCHL